MHATRLSNLLKRTVAGPMWHGPALREVLSGITAEEAQARPVAGAHSVWELVLHMAVWAEVAAERLEGRRLAPLPPEEDWPATPPPTSEAWAAAVSRLETSYRALAAAAARLSDEELLRPVPEQEHAVDVMLHGVVEHGVYHGGQVMLLRRALSGGAG